MDETAFNSEIARRLRAAREAKGLVLADVERASGGEFKASIVGAYERGERGVSPHRLHRLAALYGLRLTDFLPEAATRSARPAPSGKRASVLVVDDEPTMRAVLSAALEVERYDVATAADGVMALDLLERFVFDAIVLDRIMPRMDGITVLERIRGDRRFADIPVLVVSGIDDISELQRAVDAGASGYLTKPFQFETLFEHLDRLTARPDPTPAPQPAPDQAHLTGF